MLPSRVVLFDGDGGSSDRVVRWLLDRDRTGQLMFAPLRGDTAEMMRERYPHVPTGLRTVVYVDDGRVYVRSKAIVAALGRLPRPWRWLSALRWVPSPVLDIAYCAVAVTRRFASGRVDAGHARTARDRARILP